MSRGLAIAGIVAALLTDFIVSVASGFLVLLPCFAAIGAGIVAMLRKDKLGLGVGGALVLYAAITAFLVFGGINTEDTEVGAVSAETAHAMAVIAGSAAATLIFAFNWGKFEWRWLPWVGATLGAIGALTGWMLKEELGATTGSVFLAGLPFILLAIANVAALREFKAE